MYDVFLSIEAEDTRNAFVDHLDNALIREGMNTFRSASQIDSVEELKPETERAIKQSMSSIVVLSEKYANSPQCLDELLLIMEERRECHHFVVPIFYKVDPTDVRKQTNTFKIKVNSSTRWTKGNMDRWKRALMEICNIAGIVLSSGYVLSCSYFLYRDISWSFNDDDSTIKCIGHITCICVDKRYKRKYI